MDLAWLDVYRRWRDLIALDNELSRGPDRRRPDGLPSHLGISACLWDGPVGQPVDVAGAGATNNRIAGRLRVVREAHAAAKRELLAMLDAAATPTAAAPR